MDGDIVQYDYDADGECIWYRASALGMDCSKALIACRMGYSQVEVSHEPTLERFAAGTALEESVVELMRAEGWAVWGQQETVTLMLTGKVGMRGHIDGRAAMPPVGVDSQQYVAEVKTQSEGEWENFERNGWESGFFPRYAWQVSVYMHATGLPLMLVRGMRSKDNKSIEKIAISFIDEPFYTVAEIRAKILPIEIAALKGELPTDCSARLFPCPVPYLCNEPDREQLEGEQDAIVEAAAKTYEAACKEESLAKKRKDDAKSALLGLLQKGSKIVTMSGIKVTRFSRRNPARLPEEGLRAGLAFFHGLNLDDYKVATESEQIKVTMPNEEVQDKGL